MTVYVSSDSFCPHCTIFFVLTEVCFPLLGRQEELLDSASSTGKSTTESSTNSSKIKTLQDLFRPPIDITFKGTFEAVSSIVKQFDIV